MRTPTWSLKDIIDLEYFLRCDDRQGDESEGTSSAKRDREIYLRHIRPLTPEGSHPSPGTLIRLWLQERRHMETSASGSRIVLPGEAFEEIYRLLGYGFLIAGFMTGSGLAFSFLDYRGTEPVNVSGYLGGFILTQVLILILLLGMSLLRRWRRLPLRSSPVYLLISGLVSGLIMKIKRRALKSLSGSRRDSFEAVMGLVKGKSRTYGSLFFWPLFLQAQIFMIGFNLGLLGATLIKVTGTDIAFGWQSTLQVSARGVFELVKAVALPWSWLAPPDIAYPSLSRIEGSHMVLKEGIYRLATEDLVSWWPFLCLAVLFYGLLPRLVLIILGLVFQKRALGRVDFSHSACERLVQRMRTPMVSTEGRAGGPESIRSEVRIPETALPEEGEAIPDKGLVALIPDDIFEACPDEELEKVVTRTFGYPLRKKLRFGEGDADEGRILDEISRLKEEEPLSDILVLQEGWQPPIREKVRFIKALRKALGKTAKLKVGLIGRPVPGRFFSRTKEAEWKAWVQRTAALGDPYLELERLVLNDGRQDP